MRRTQSQANANKNRKKIYWPLNEYTVIHFENQTIQNSEYRKIAYHRHNIIGRGSYGVVYLAHPVDRETGEIDLRTMLAVKKFHKNHELNMKEAAFFNAYYGRSELLHAGEDDFMVMQYIAGISIMKNNSRSSKYGLNDKLINLDFCMRVKIILSIMMTINLMHHDTPHTGQALVHGDINGSNILINLDELSGAVNVHIIDFGLARELGVPQDAMQPAPMVGTPLFMPKELADDISLHGVKTDIFSLTPIFASILGVNDPFVNRSKLRWYEKQYYETPYDLTGLCESVAMENYPFKIKKLLLRFLARMQSIDSVNRPDSDETLLFFVKLNLFCMTYDLNHHDTSLPLLVAMLARLVAGRSIVDLEQSENGARDRLVNDAIKPYLVRKVDLENDQHLAVYESFIAKGSYRLR